MAEPMTRSEARKAVTPQPREETRVVLTDVYSGKTWVVDTRPDPMYRDDAWTTRDGEEIPITEMEASHIANVIYFLERRARALHRLAIQKMIDDLSGPFAPSGDWACDSFDAAFDELLNMSPMEWLASTPIVQALHAELQRRETS
jgi:hypothetical protein